MGAGKLGEIWAGGPMETESPSGTVVLRRAFPKEPCGFRRATRIRSIVNQRISKTGDSVVFIRVAYTGQGS